MTGEENDNFFDSVFLDQNLGDVGNSGTSFDWMNNNYSTNSNYSDNNTSMVLGESQQQHHVSFDPLLSDGIMDVSSNSALTNQEGISPRWLNTVDSFTVNQPNFVPDITDSIANREPSNFIEAPFLGMLVIFFFFNFLLRMDLVFQNLLL